MTSRFSVGDHVTWNSEAGQVSGKIIKVHVKNIAYKSIPTMRARKTLSMKSRATRPTIAMHKGFEAAAVFVAFSSRELKPPNITAYTMRS
jgi:hypothetical protein